ncbi:DUF544 domain protein [Aspergillus clavatus NRRL 1]|uniref:DUF544 domain protein n=1 Tax=Aspergillus clavatus (strain ATCC 1007 / CBS 513.65 / DSM 816 / NCTC 3887 / NRRL 1 / QM 1276 / 107) TaxID=344612 RepID=A1C5G8_ASPCL|nr:DUF544 domain protein [Aspergillus clavatus NRRL 1]EAW14936.1 DUF544 domain protein [Aspergillus clavatus NRRL 1]
MVLRKRAPPHLSNLNQPDARSELRSPISPTSPTAKSVSAPSPKRLTRPRRAKSSPHPHRIPSLDPIYSPDLNTSPAFDLMPLEQAQKAPVGPLSSDNPNPWADDASERPAKSAHIPEQTAPSSIDQQAHLSTNVEKFDRVPPILVAGTQRRMAANEWQEANNNSGSWEAPVQLQSNNPFLKTRQAEENPWDSNNSKASHGDGSSGRLSQTEGYIPMTARLSLLDQPAPESPWAEERSDPAAQSPAWPNVPMHTQHTAPPHQVPYNNGPTPGQTSSIFDGHDYAVQYPQQTSYGRPVSGQSPATAGATTSTTMPPSSHDLIDFGGPSEVSASQAQIDLEYAPYPSDAQTPGTSSNIYTESAPPLPQRSDPSESLPEQSPALPPRSPNLTAAEEQRQKGQRSETYSIRHINWTDQTGKLRESPILVQNQNGPCPLLALVNTLVLRADQDTQPPIVRALQTKEQISLGLLIEALFDELTTRLGPDGELPDIEALSRFLTMLHTGMNVNPRLTLESNEAFGTFLKTGDIRLYSTFGVPLVHGWIATPATEADEAFRRLAQYHEDVQMLPFRKQELEDRVFRGDTLTWEEEQVIKDIQAIEKFTDVENATQLSAFGLKHLTEMMPPGSFAILFRNDHFSTLYKHPQRRELFTLVTDAGYSSHAEVVWECLIDVNGSNSTFFAGDFRPVGHTPPETSDPSGPRISSHRTTVPPPPSEQQTANTLSPQEQADADYAYALSLQYQEEERQAREGNNRQQNQRASAPNYPPGTSWGPDPAHRRAASVANGGGSRQTADRRSTGQSHPPGRYSTSRLENDRNTSGNADDLLPPSYEQAATSPAYPPRDAPDGRYQRHSTGRRIAPGPGTGLPDRPKDRNKDCVVM